MDASSSFPWELLPSSMQEEILSKLPISVLLRLRSISRSFLSSIRSLPPSLPFPRDPFFLVYPQFSSSSFSLSSAVVFQPYLNRWLSMPLSSTPLAASGPLLLISKSSDTIFNPFSGSSIPIPPPLGISSLIFSVSVLIDDGDAHRSTFRIVNVNNSDRVRAQIYDSASGSWTPRGELPGRFTILRGAVFLDGFLYFLSRGPEHLLRFDLSSGDWEIVAEVLPSLVFAHLVAFDRRLFLVGGVRLSGVMVSIKVLEFVRKKGEDWELVCSMPDEIFGEFGLGIGRFFRVCERKGMVCFCNLLQDRLLMLDLMDWRWWWPCHCLLPLPLNNRGFLGVAVEPNAELLLS